MPVRSVTINTSICFHNSPSEFLETVSPWIAPKRQREANIWLPHALKAAHNELYKPPIQSSLSPATPEQFWMTSWTHRRSVTGEESSTLDFILTCTQHHLGTYPIFLASVHPEKALTPAFLFPRLEQLAERLASCTKRERVYSIFGQDAAVKCFVPIWCNLTCSTPEPDPLYAAKLTFCTRASLTKAKAPPPEGHKMRLAEPQDAEGAAFLCKWFADDSVHFPLDYSSALKEAEEMIRQKQLWLYSITMPGGKSPVLASIVACTRVSERVAAITKVFTNPSCRSQGCAERLVRRVSEFWLCEKQKSSVVLYVAHDNPAAATVYHRVGFVGLQRGGPPVEGVEDWTEIAIADTKRGHW